MVREKIVLDTGVRGCRIYLECHGVPSSLTRGDRR